MTLYTPEREVRLLDELDPSIRQPMARVIETGRNLIDYHRLDCRLVVFMCGRTYDEQWRLFQKGREKRDGKWVRVGNVVTNAKPDETPHCVRRREGSRVIRSSLAADLWLLEQGADKLIPDRDPRWAVLPLAVGIAAGETLRSGAFFSFGSGDFPHVEALNWKEIAARYAAEIGDTP